MTLTRARVRVEGIVQGVGFRPFVHALAGRLGLAGLVGNDPGGVFVEVEGPAETVERFLAAMAAEAPPLAVIERVTATQLAPTGIPGFAIAPSQAGGERQALVSPDTATCADCLRELGDPADRRHRYPFINCTNCGPRFTIVRDVPYDRPAPVRGRPGRGGHAGQPAAADRPAAAAALGGGRRAGGATEPLAGGDAALHPTAPPAAGRDGPADRADQRERVRRADRLPGRRGAGTARRGRRLVPRPRPPDPRPGRRLGGAGVPGARAAPAALAGVRAPAARAALAVPAARPGLRGRAQAHLLPGQGRPRLRLPSHRRPGELRDLPLLHRGGL